MLLRRLHLCLLLFVFSAAAAKRPLTNKDFDSWRSILSPALSHDGHYLAYGLFPQEGDGAVVVRDLVTGKEWRENAGELPPPPAPDPNAEEAPVRQRTMRLAFTADSKTLAFVTFPAHIPKDNKKSDLVTIDLATGTASRVAQVASFAIAEKGSDVIAYLKQAGTEKKYGTDIVLRNLADKTERTFPDVLEYSLSKDGKTLVYAVASAKEDTDGVYAVAAGGGAPRALLSGKGKYAKLAFDDKQDQLAFVSDRDGKFKLYLWNAKAAKADEIASNAISDKATLSFSKDGSSLFFGTGPASAPERKPVASEDVAVFDLWHYKDDHIQPMQKVRAAADRTRSFRAVYHIASHKVVQLADLEMTDATPNESGRYALGSDDREYRPMVEYGERLSDTYLVDTETGTRKLLAKKHGGAVVWSPDGKYALMFDGKDWITIGVPAGKQTNLTAKLGVKFWMEETDTPSTARPYGSAGWTKDGKYVLLYDHFDIWQVAPDGSGASNLTQGAGRAQNLEFRYVKVDAEEKSIDTGKPLLLRAENTDTRESGFYRDRIDSKTAPEKLVMAAKDFGGVVKAKDADVMVLTEQTFTEFPDLMATDSTMKELRKVSDANPQQKDLNWGAAEMVHFKSLDGVALEGALYKPENFEADKKYPMLVYIYEKLSQNINHYVEPKPMDSINISYYVSNGYLVFTPDIVYSIGYPGQSALKCVMAGVDAVVAKGIVDEKNIGIQGHSWGGYQIAYMITQTSRFKAVEAGAPVANMTSAYNGIRWGPGLPRQFQYEKTQSRIGGSLWEYPLRFIENSPIFQADRIQTPVLMVHNDADDAVPWYQGIEFYLGLRRLGKEVYFFSYAGEPHHLRKRANQKDYAIRMQQYFDYELKGAKKPDWMERGIPFLERGREKPVSDQ